ncbi:MAG: hypothetical protein K2Q12_08415 [Rickettsiales bacterium]|nr:hypothetical protein [Rickettsiales bacterium]
MSSIATFTFLDEYCERAGDAALWAEPLNAITNLAFIFAAWRAGRDYWHMERHLCWRTLDMILLIVILAAIGVGSGLWHLYATKETMLADVIPITLFINLYLLCFLRRVMRMGWEWIGILWLGFFLVTYAAQSILPPDLLNGSVMYAPAFLTLLMLGLWAKRHALPEASLLWTAIALFSLSITFRTIDHSVCAYVPYGTHFLWHLLNAVVLYLLLRLLIVRAHVNGEH